MARTIPIALQAHQDQTATTMCGLLRIGPVDGPAFGYSSTNRAIEYDDGDGLIAYAVMSGFDQSAIVSTSTTEVDNAEARILLLTGGSVTEAMALAGYLDGAQFTVYAVNYASLSDGHEVVQHGYLGKPKIGKGGGTLTLELRSLLDLLRQTPWEKWQRRCRVKVFGSQPGDERFPCNFVLAPEWVTGVAVTSVGVESDRTFTASSLAQAADYFAPGMWLWTTGPNAGKSYEIESFGLGGVITLRFATDYPITAGDDGDVRRDCTRNWSGQNSCDTFSNRPNFRGEPKMRPADALATQIPGAQASPGNGGETFVPETAEA